MHEIWKNIKGFEGYYQVSNLGNVRSLDRFVPNGDRLQFRHGKLKTLMDSPDGYSIVKLSKNNIDKNYYVHVLVAQEFIDYREYSDGWEVDHKDSNRKNNMVDNLKWVTHKENVRHAAEEGHMQRFGARNSNYHNDTLKKKYEEHPELKMCCSRPGKENGRSIPIILTNISNNSQMNFDYIRQCSKYLINNNLVNNKNIDGLSTIIKKHIDKNEPYKGFIFSLQ